MIQRPQSLFLLLVAILMTIVAISPLQEIANTAATQETVVTALSTKVYEIDARGERGQLLESSNTAAIFVSAVVAAILALVSLFMFKKRLSQIQLGGLNSLFIGLAAVLSILQVSKVGEVNGYTSAQPSNIAYYLPFIALIFNMVASRLIRKDEKLVRSMDRIR